MTESESCFSCSHKIGGEHCPLERRKEAALRGKIAEMREDVGSDEEVVEELAGEQIRIIMKGKDGRKYQFLTLSEKEIRSRIEKGANSLYGENACGNWEPIEGYPVEEMMDIAERAEPDERFEGRSPEKMRKFEEGR